MPLLANPPKPLLAANNYIIPFYQLIGINHACNVCAITSLQIPQVISGYIVFILSVLTF
jgi:hypothetical protein